MTEGHRRLAAIMLTDMVGYTALGQRNESVSLALVEEQRKLLRPIFKRHNGNEIKTIGDSFLVEFPSALDAVRCAYDVQRATREFNVSLPGDRRFHLKVGIHLGDVVESKGDISGDAVNVASRIEPLAEEGGVCLTRQVYDLVQNKFELPMVSLGLKALKNVNKPLEVYQLVMPWHEEGISRPARLDKTRIAVLPFANMSPDPADQYFADGMMEELITSLSGVKAFSVIARTSVMRYRASPKGATEIGGELSAGTLIEGSVRKAGNRVRITVQLIDARSEDHVWARNYDREIGDIFTIQNEIAESVAKELSVQLGKPEKQRLEQRATQSTEAYMLYLKGRFHWNARSDEGLNRAIVFFEEAISRDPQYALAYAGLADCYTMLGVYCYRRPATVFPKAKELAAKTLSLNDNLAEAHASMFEILAHYDFDWTKAHSEIEKALELNPSYAQAHAWRGSCYLASHGRFDEALTEMRKAEELDPLSMIIATEVGKVLYLAGRTDAALDKYQKSLEIDPHFAIAHKGLAEVYASLSKYDDAIDEIEKAIDLSKRSVFILDDLGYIYAVSGREDEARRVLSDLEEISTKMYVPPYGRAAIHAGLGENDKAFEWLHKAYEERSFLTWLNVDPAFHTLRNDSRFNRIVEKLGLG